MNRIYRLIAIVLVLIGLLVLTKVAKDALDDMTNIYSPNTIKCDSRGCRSILSDGTLADDEVTKPSEVTR